MLKFESRFPLWLLVIAIGASLGNVYFAIARADGSGASIFSVLATTVLSALFVLALFNRLRRPTVEIGDDSISHGPVFQAVRRRTKLSEISEMLPPSPASVVVRMKSGRKRRISIREVARTDRDAARQAIGEAISRD